MAKKIAFLIALFSLAAALFGSGQVRILPLASALLESNTPVYLICDGSEEMIFCSFSRNSALGSTDLIFIPLPSEPAQERYNHGEFRVLQKTLTGKLFRFSNDTKSVSLPASLLEPDLSTVNDSRAYSRSIQLKDWDDFLSAVSGIFSNLKIAAPKCGRDLQRYVEENIASGNSHFYFFLRNSDNDGKADLPLLIRFSTKKLFFPLRGCNPAKSDENLLMIMILPGSIGFLSDRSDIRAFLETSPSGGWELSSSAKLYADQSGDDGTEQILSLSDIPKLYLQLARYSGESAFTKDLLLEVGNLAPLAYAPELSIEGNELFPEDLFSLGELLDMREAIKKNAESKKYFIPSGPFSVEIQGYSNLKPECLQAEMRALELEIASWDIKIRAAREGPGDPANLDTFLKRRAGLVAELFSLRELRVSNYRLPEKLTVNVHVVSPLQDNGLLDAEGTSRSGPFYHIAGIRDGVYSAISPGSDYELTIYLVRKRDYPFPDFYVYIAEWKKI